MIGEPNASPRPLTVLMTVDTVGGVWPYAVGLCRSLPEIRFVLATMGPRPRQSQRDEIRGLENVVLAESDFSLEWMANGAADFAESRTWLMRLIEKHDADIIHVNGYAHARLGTNLSVLVVAHSDVCSWWAAVHKCGPPSEWGDYRRAVAAGLTAASRIVAPTAAVLHDLERYYLRLSIPAAVIPNGVDLPAFPASAKRPVIVAAGRLWDDAKNLTALGAVAPQLAWPVAIAGDIEHPEGGIANLTNARLLGRLTPAEMARLLGSASIFAAPARYEPFGLAILEAAAAGCAPVLGDIPSLRENWDEAALFVDPEDPSALCSAVNALIADADELNRLQTAARYRARHFTLQRMAGAYATLYREMASNFVCVATA